MVAGFISIGAILFIAILGGIFGYGRICERVDNNKELLSNHLATDTKGIKDSIAECHSKIGGVHEKINAVAADVAFVKGKLNKGI